MEESQLATQIPISEHLQGHSRHSSFTTERDSLIAEYHDFVEFLVTRLIRAMTLPVTLREDFIAAGYLGLVEAASRFDPGKGSDFRSFAFFRIRGAVIDHIRDSCYLSGHSYRMLKALESGNEMRGAQLEGRRHRTGSSHERAREAVDVMSKGAVAFKILRGREAIEATDDVSPSDPEHDLAEKQMSSKIRQIIATLPEKERIIVEQYYFNDLKLTEIAEQYSGLSKSWVSRLHERALEMLRSRLVASGLVEVE